MDIGQAKLVHPGAEASQPPKALFKPFARPRQKRRRVLPSKPGVISVRPNPPHYVLNFTDGKQPERSLVNILSSEKRAVSVVGLPGSGKTVILRAVAYGSDITAMFRDGIFLVPFALTTSISMFFDHLFELLKHLGANDQLIINLRERKEDTPQNHQKTIDTFISTIRDKKALLMFDAVASQPADVYSLLTALVDSSPRTRRYTLACSTRSHDVARMFSSGTVVNVPLHDPTGTASRGILCSHAAFDRAKFDASCDQPTNAIIPVLHKCSGLPLALAVAGGAVKRLLVSANPDNMNSLIWSHYRSYLINSFDQFGQISGLFSGLSSCVDSVPVDKDWKTKLSVWEVFCSLGIVRNGTWVPYHILQRLWALKKRDDVISVVRPLSRHCLVTRERRGVAVGVLIADVVLDYCRHEAMKRMGLRKWHLNLLKSYVDQALLKDVAGQPPASWEKFAEESQYLSDHLEYHSEEAQANASEREAPKYREICEEATRIVFKNILDDSDNADASAPTSPTKPAGSVYFITGDL